MALGAAAFVIGLTGAMAPGPFLTVTITETLRNGRLAALKLLVGHAVLELTLIVGLALGLKTVLDADAVVLIVSLAGGGFLLWMALDLLIGAARGSITLDLADSGAELRYGPVAQGAAVSLSNPYWTLWWLTIGVKLAMDGIGMGASGVAAFFLGHELADLAWYGLVVTVVHSGRRLLTPRSYRAVIALCALFLLYLGADFVWEGIASLTSR